ncbi:LysR family transcriptional regulator [Variovorax atrisoli]|jgi:DNA-binding transcriptional LysR family regulator|uniref:LysR family transcriptional regulator n=1 Tax=Variovorax atrisoli TaxID=3394203 RepID=UPI00104C589F|nr:LysR family transcriptional regulator [Variovorax sp. BK613]MBB3643685.1 DNA-binding transcriptional LysR family regulator [Variovorax sp. BK613]
MDRFKALQNFVQIADQGSLTRAAEALGTSLPAVVRSLAALEAHLGVRLFHRTTRRLSLTEEGRSYLPSARELLLAADAADLALKAEAREPAGQLTITAPVLFGHMYVAPAIVRFMQRYEKVRCSVRLYDRTVNLLEEGIDVGIRISPLEDSSLVAQTMGTIRRVLVASPDYLARHGTPMHPRELNGAPCVRGRVDAPTQWQFYEGGKAIGVTPDTRLEFNHLAPAIESCAAGMGFGTFFSYQVMPHVAQGRLKLVLEDFEPPPRPVSVIYPNARLLPARTRAFIDWMKMEFEGLRL